MKAMRHVTLTFVAIALPCLAPAQTNRALTVVPAPEHVRFAHGEFVLRDRVHIVADSSNARLREIASFLAEIVRDQTGYAVTIHPAQTPAPSIILESRGGAPDDEQYELDVSSSAIRITAASPTGVFWGVQTLRQLLMHSAPLAAVGTLRSDSVPPGPASRVPGLSIPALEIRDAPRFKWRGSLLDVARHFFPVEFVERYIDLLSRYKMNVLHWHLTDDQGWRVAIDGYPRLTEFGAWRVDPDGSRYGGFYTKADIRRIVEYARLRNVTVVPEIEMPGHAQAAIASYPELGCTGDTVPVATQWGVMKEIYCVGNPHTFEFLENVLDEVMDLFPSAYIHIGGDEVPKDRWRGCESCQALMKREGLADESQLQSWFIERIERYLRQHGRRLIGWDEILEGGLASGATVQVWRDMAHAKAAVEHGADVIVSPTSHAYFDGSPRILPLQKVYAFDPIPPDLDSVDTRRILGGEANIWTEFITTANFDVMVFPRLLAMSEALWSRGPRDFTDFHRRLREVHYPRLNALGVRIGPENGDVIRLTTVFDSAAMSARVLVEQGVDELIVRYTTDGTAPTAESPRHHDSISFREPGTVTVRPFIAGEPLPLMSRFTIVDHAARGKPVASITSPSTQYPGTGTRTLTDGLLGSTNHHDGLWQGWVGKHLDAVIDLGAVRSVDSVAVSFLQAAQSWILLPKDVSVMFSDDGITWSEPFTSTHDVPPERNDALRLVLTVHMPDDARARYIKVLARQFGALPTWHPGAGRPAWIFADEIIVR